MTKHEVKVMRCALKLQDVYNHHREINGAKWPAVVAEVRPLIQSIAKESKQSILGVAALLSKDARLKGVDGSLFLAVAAEMIQEPSAKP